MSVASLAGYLTNGGQSSYYKAYSLNEATALTSVNTGIFLFGAEGITAPLPGTYLISTFLLFKTYDAENGEEGNIDVLEVAVLYNTQSTETYINNQIYQFAGNCIQTSGIFTSDGTGSFNVFIKPMSATNATQYTVALAGGLSPQVQIVKIA